MTAKPNEKNRLPHDIPSAAYAVLIFFFFLLFWKNQTLTAAAARDAAILSVRAVIPAIFPFAVLSEWTVSTSAYLVFGKPLGKILRLSPTEASLLLLGSLCGFPVGAKFIASLYEKNAVTREEAERLLLFSGGASPAFLIGSVGNGLFGDVKIGIFLFAASVTLNLATSFFCRSGTRRAENPILCEKPSLSVVSSLRSALFASLSVLAATVFFSVIGTALVSCLPENAPASLGAAIRGILELSSGIKASCDTLNRETALVSCGFFVGFSGFSVHLQTASVFPANQPPPRLSRYLTVKLLHGLCLSVIAFLACRFDLI